MLYRTLCLRLRRACSRFHLFLLLFLAPGGHEASELFDVCDSIFHSAIGDGEHEYLFFLGQHADAFFDFGHVEGGHVAVEILDVQIVSRMHPILFAANI